jgi:hypothetical protein
MVSVDEERGRRCILPATKPFVRTTQNDAAWVFDNLVDCIRQPRRNDLSDKIKIRRVNEPLREAGV